MSRKRPTDHWTERHGRMIPAGTEVSGERERSRMILSSQSFVGAKAKDGRCKPALRTTRARGGRAIGTERPIVFRRGGRQ